MADLSALERFANGATPDEDEEIKPFQAIDLSRQILVFDQSLANTGYALIYGQQVAATGNITTEIVDKGDEDNFRRGLVIYEAVRGLINHFQPTHILHENPPVGGRTIRPDSSLISAMAIRVAAHRTDIPIAMLHARTAKKRWTGNANAKKKPMKTAMLSLHPWLNQIKPMNEAIIDALAIGFLAAEMTDGEVGWTR